MVINMNANDESPTSASEEVLAELRDFCQSQALSEHALRQRLSSLDTQDNSSYYDVLFDICDNEHVTPGILKCFIEYFPGALRCVEDSRGLTPLHSVLRNKNCTVDIVMCFTEAFSDILQSQDDEGITPLFILCSNPMLDQIEAVKILRLFMEECPECAQYRFGGFLPIEVAARRKRSQEFCCVLVDAFPESVIRREDEDVEGVPLLVTVLQSPNIDDRIALALLKMLLKNYRDMIRRFWWGGLSPLHIVAVARIPRSEELCRLLIEAVPELVDTFTSSVDDPWKPLHFACKKANLPVVKCILSMRPNAIVDETTNGGAFPIHLAVYALQSCPNDAVEVVKFLLTDDVVNVASQAAQGITFPLSTACFCTNESNLSVGLHVIKLLFDAHPEAIATLVGLQAIATLGGRVTAEVADFLHLQLRYFEIANDRQLVQTPDENGDLPIHRALRERVALGTYKLLAEADLTTLQTTNRNGNTVLHEACLIPDYDVVQMLLTRYPTSIVCSSITNSHGKLPIQLLLEHEYNTAESARHLNCIFLLLRANPVIWMRDANI